MPWNFEATLEKRSAGASPEGTAAADRPVIGSLVATDPRRRDQRAWPSAVGGGRQPASPAGAASRVLTGRRPGSHGPSGATAAAARTRARRRITRPTGRSLVPAAQLVAQSPVRRAAAACARRLAGGTV